MTFFNDFHWFSMTFPGKMPFFQVNIKFHDFSSQGLNSMTFPGLCEPWPPTAVPGCVDERMAFLEYGHFDLDACENDHVQLLLLKTGNMK